VTLRGEPYLLWRAVDQQVGAELDILLQKRRDKAAAKRFFKRVLASHTEAPRKIVTNQLRSYSAAKAEITALAHVKHVFVKASARINNRAENSHQPSRERERHMRGFRDPEHTQAFLSNFGPIRSTSRSSDTCSAPHSIANSSPHASPPGIVSLRPPKIRPLSEQARVLSAIASRTLQRDSAVGTALSPVASSFAWLRRYGGNTFGPRLRAFKTGCAGGYPD
jgi:hypothetical protein